MPKRKYGPGSKRGKLTIINRLPGQKFKCRCDCGNTAIVDSSNFSRDQGCGCELKKLDEDRSNLLGKKFGRLTPINRIGKRADAVDWLCKCDCGSKKIISSKGLRAGSTRSCGCLQRERVSKMAIARADKCRANNFDTAINLTFKSYQKRAESKNLHWDLSLKAAKKLFLSNCCYCGSPPQPKQLRKIRTTDGYKCRPLIENLNGIDRIDSDLGYVKGNVVASCTVCNYMKLDHSKEAFLSQAAKIVEYQTKKKEQL